METVVADFLKSAKIPISKKYVERLIASHPEFPSVLSVSDTLHRLGINHVARRIKYEELSEISFPYLLPLDIGKGGLISIRNEKELVENQENLKKWGGVVLQVEPSDQTNDEINNDLHKKESGIRKYATGAIVAMLILSYYPFIDNFSFLWISLVTTAIAGMTVGYFLIAKDAGIAFKAIDDFCAPGKNVDCDKVLEDDINFLGFRLSEATLIYFIFQFVVISLTNLIPNDVRFLLQTLGFFSLLTIPVVLFSICYQYFVLKTWCKLCLVVSAVLIIQFVVFTIAYSNNSFHLFSPDDGAIARYVVPLILTFACISATVKAVKTTVERTAKLTQEHTEASRVKHFMPVFHRLLSQTKTVEMQAFEKEMVVGNREAPISIIIVSNLHCKPCREKHRLTEQLVRMYPDLVRVSLRFVRTDKYMVDGLESSSYLFGAWLTHVHDKENEGEKTLALLHDWFEIWNLESFAKKWSVDDSHREEIKRMEQQSGEWVKKAGIHLTPTIFLEGQELPRNYSVEDLMAMAPGISDLVTKFKSAEVELKTV